MEPPPSSSYLQGRRRRRRASVWLWRCMCGAACAAVAAAARRLRQLQWLRAAAWLRGCVAGVLARRRGGCVGTAAWRRGSAVVRWCGGALSEEVKQNQDLLLRVPARRPQHRWSVCGSCGMVPQRRA